MSTFTGTVRTVARPYTLVFLSSGNAYPLSSEDAQRLIDEYPVIYASRNRVELRIARLKNAVEASKVTSALEDCPL